MSENLREQIKEGVREVLKGAEITVVSCLRYDRRLHDYVQEDHAILHVKGDPEGFVQGVIKGLGRRGAIFKGEFEELPVEEREKLYSEALGKAMKWWEVFCEECEKPINLFTTKYFKTEPYKDFEGAEFCEKCEEDTIYTPDKDITDELLAKAVEKGKPTYKLVDDVAIVLVGKEKELLFEKEYPLSIEALKKFGGEAR